MKIIEKLPTMSTADTVRLWRNTLSALDAGKYVVQAQLVLQAVQKEWDRRAVRTDDGEWFGWPTTLASDGNGALDTEGWRREGMLKYLGYSVGNQSSGLPRERRRMLSEIFHGHLPPAFPSSYQEQWGSRGSSRRLRKLAESIAAFARNAKRKKGADMHVAIADWEADLEYLYLQYYCGKFRFGWPGTSVDS